MNKYKYYIESQINCLKENDLPSQIGLDYKMGLQSMIDENPNKAINLFKSAYEGLRKIKIKDYSTFQLKVRGDCLLNGMVISEIYDKKYDLDDFELSDIECFTCLWGSYEMSNLNLFASLTSLSELFSDFVRGKFVMSACERFTDMRQDPINVAFAIQNIRFTYITEKLRSLGSPHLRAYKFYYSDNEVQALQGKEKSDYLSYEKELEDCYKRLSEIVENLNSKYKANLDTDGWIKASSKPVSEDLPSYWDYAHSMIRSLKTTLKHDENVDEFTLSFSTLPISQEEAFNNENYYALLTTVYSNKHWYDLVMDQKKMTSKEWAKEVSDELIAFASKYYQKGIYGTPLHLLTEALYLTPNRSEIEDRKLEIGTKLVEEEMGISLDNH